VHAWRVGPTHRSGQALISHSFKNGFAMDLDRIVQYTVEIETEPGRSR
jgi:hypothetical protein